MKRLLIIDDDELDRKMMVDALRKTDSRITVHEVSRGPEAYSAAKRLWPIAALLDVRMPDMDGFEVLSIIRQDGKLTDMPVMMLSGSDDPDDMRRADELGATAYRVKPSSRKGYTNLAEDICHHWLS
jgi:CheY-like chemotaxis protein